MSLNMLIKVGDNIRKHNASQISGKYKIIKSYGLSFMKYIYISYFIFLTFTNIINHKYCMSWSVLIWLYIAKSGNVQKWHFAPTGYRRMLFMCLLSSMFNILHDDIASKSVNGLYQWNWYRQLIEYKVDSIGFREYGKFQHAFKHRLRYLCHKINWIVIWIWLTIMYM